MQSEMGGGYSSHFADEETEASSGVTFPGQVIILNLHLPDSEATLHPGNIFEAFKPIVVCVCVRVYVRERDHASECAERTRSCLGLRRGQSNCPSDWCQRRKKQP